MDFELIKRLIKVLEESDLTGLSVEEKGVKIELRKEKGQVVAAAPMPAFSAPSHGSESAKKKPDEIEEGLVAITSPMVGTFYRSPSPDAPSFTDVNKPVEVGQTVCIIEAMKLFNEIESEVKGKVVKILVENAQPVEYGQKLMLIRPE